LHIVINFEQTFGNFELQFRTLTACSALPVLRCSSSTAFFAQLSLLSFVCSTFFAQLLVFKMRQLLVDPQMAQNQK